MRAGRPGAWGRALVGPAVAAASVAALVASPGVALGLHGVLSVSVSEEKID